MWFVERLLGEWEINGRIMMRDGIEITQNGVVPYPPVEFQLGLDSVLSIRIAADEKGNELLWMLDFGHHGFGTPRLIAIDITSNHVVHHYIFPSDVAPFLSMLNDFQVDSVKQVIYIADAGYVIL